jgi:hypothetical protein
LEQDPINSALVTFSTPITKGDLQRLAGLQITTTSHDQGFVA